MLNFYSEEINRKLSWNRIIPYPVKKNIYFFAIFKTVVGSKLDNKVDDSNLLKMYF